MGNYLYDLVLYLILAGLTIGLTHAFQVKRLISGDAQVAIIYLLVFYGLANIPLTYMLSYLFKSYGDAKGIVFFLNLVVGALIPSFIMKLRLEFDAPFSLSLALSYIFRIFPSFSVRASAKGVKIPFSAASESWAASA